MSYEQRLVDHIDWAHPDLSIVSIDPKSASPRQRLLTVIGRIRDHGPTYFGFSDSYFTAMRRSASEPDIAQAGQKIDTALQGDLYYPPHSNALAALGGQVLHLGLNEQRAAAISQRVLSREADWSNNVWTFGITWGVAELLRHLCVHPACRDEDLLPVLGWLCDIAPVEWASQLQWSERMLGCSGHNWWVHSLLGFWMAGAMFPYVNGFERFAALAPAYLEHVAEVLFAEDGWSREGSAAYHQFAALNVVEFARMAQRRGVVLSEAFWSKLRTIADASWLMLGPDGSQPTFGDTVWRPWASVERVRRLAARFTLTRAKGALQQLKAQPDGHPSFLPDSGDDLAGAFNAMPGEPPPLDTSLPRSGLYAMRSDWTATGDWMAINAMPLGEVVSSHKHADLFNIELCVRGRRVLVDNGYGDVHTNDGSHQSTPEIRNDPMKRRWRVGSSAHNVATVNHQDQVPVERIYRYGRQVSPLVQAFRSTDRCCCFHGVHEAYRHLEHPVTAHRRGVFYLRGQYWIVTDRFTVDGEAPRSFQQHLHVPKGAELMADGRVRTHGDGGNLVIAPVIGLTGVLTIAPNPHPISTYENPDHVTIDASATGNCVMAFALVPFEGNDVPDVTVRVLEVESDQRRLSPWEATALSITVRGREDVYFTQHTHWNLPWTAGGRSGTGRQYHSQCDEDDR